MLFINPIADMVIQRGDTAFSEAERQEVVLQEFEHLFAFQLLTEMRKTVHKGELFNGGREQEIYEEMLDDVLSGQLAASGQLGIADAIAEQLRVGAMQHEIRTQLHGASPQETRYMRFPAQE